MGNKHPAFPQIIHCSFATVLVLEFEACGLGSSIGDMEADLIESARSLRSVRLLKKFKKVLSQPFDLQPQFFEPMFSYKTFVRFF